MSVDFHTHYIDASLEGMTLPGCVALRRDGAAGQLLQHGAVYRTIDERSWDVARRIADMDAEGVALQVLSPIPVSYAYEASSTAGASFSRAQNDALAGIVRARPDRFAALGTVPLQDPQLACAELERAVRELGLHGVEIGTTAGGRDLDDAELDPFWERCEALGAVVFVHPESAPGFDRMRRRMMVISTGYPNETGIAAAMLLTSGLLERRKLRIVLAHGGGTLPWLLPRLDRLWEISDDLRAAGRRPSEVARSFYCDTLTFDVRNLALILERFDPSHLVVGSDYPFSIRETPPGAVVDAFPEHAAALRSANAHALLNRTAETSA
ncbi:MAG: aminocarboxymuconate-semialdehyde decarboxylase [Candidatus Eremiobacteraeota bacterium]|jgi:aminocarboxymuconate-semialdehyde decarboxylase|nr:aminocarboxymuconate-semialdehyde decarboxylase [Candidatus Eremiobacteraeota bacterium]